MATAKKAVAKKPKTIAAKTPRRPAINPSMPMQGLEYITRDMNDIKNTLEEFAVHLRSLDRMRLNGVGIKKQGFIERAYELALENEEFLPHYLTIQKFGEDYAYFTGFRTLFDIGKQIQEIIWNITIQAADMVYTDALEFYAPVREAAKRRVDAAESIYRELEIFFKKKKTAGSEPTEREIKRDVNALLRGKKDGKIVVENVKPKLTGGKHKVIDEKFNDTAQFKETEEGSIKD
jgi:hypothetical protein